MDQARAEPPPEFEEIKWHIDGQLGATTGVLVGQTRRGMTMVTEHQSGCCEGNVLIPSDQFQWRGWRRPVQIKRIVQLSDAIDLIAADYITAKAARQAPYDDESPTIP